MKNELKKIMKELDYEFPGITDPSLIKFIQERQEKKERNKNGLQCFLFVLIFFSLVFFILFFTFSSLKVEITISVYIRFIIISLVMTLPPAILLFKNYT